MATFTPLLLRIMGTAIPAAEIAGSIIKDVLVSGDLKIKYKGFNDLQTEADRLAQTCIMASLFKLYPKLNLIGEEGEPENLLDYTGKIANIPDQQVGQLSCPDELKNLKEEELVVWIDPLDGTSDFVNGILSSVTVLIGIACDGKPIAGVVHQPFYNGEKGNPRTFWGIVGVGHGGFSPNLLPDRSGLVIVTSPFSRVRSIEVQNIIHSLKPNKVLRAGGVGSKILLLLDGSADAYIFTGSYTKKWDTCGPEAVIRAVSGQLTDIYGSNYSYSKNASLQNEYGILATVHYSYHEMCTKAFSKFTM